MSNIELLKTGFIHFRNDKENGSLYFSVLSEVEEDMINLKSEFGGSYGKTRAGYLWTVSHRKMRNVLKLVLNQERMKTFRLTEHPCPQVFPKTTGFKTASTL